jgi:hypothetical protein
VSQKENLWNIDEKLELKEIVLRETIEIKCCAEIDVDFKAD